MATFDPIFAADPNNPELIAADASITIFDPDDPGMAPVTITDPTGSPLTNPLTVNDKGWGPAFMTGETLFRVGWSGAGFTGFFTSYESMRDAALDAKASAESAATSATNASAAAVAAQEAAEDAAMSASGGGFAIDPGNPDVLLISTLDDGTVAVDPTNSNVLLITT